MSRLYTSGYELNTNSEFTSNTGSPVIQTTTVRNGKYAGQITSLQSAAIQGWLANYASATGNGPFYSRFYINISAYPTADNAICFYTSGTNLSLATPDTSIKVSSTGTLKLFNQAGAQIGAASSVLSLNVWYMVEHKLDLTGGAGAQVIQGKLEGTAFATSTTDVNSSPVKSFAVGGNLLGELQTTGTWYLEDIAINDGTGSSYNTYPGALAQTRSSISMYLKQGFQ